MISTQKRDRRNPAAFFVGRASQQIINIHKSIVALIEADAGLRQLKTAINPSVMLSVRAISIASVSFHTVLLER